MKIEIVVAYNTQVDMTKEFLDKMQESLRVTEHTVGCILVHGYVDNEEDIEHHFITKFIKLKNDGFCKTLNAGLMQVSDDTDYIFMVGNDSFPLEQGWLDKLVKAHAQFYADGIISPLATNPPEKAFKHLFVGESTPEYHYANFFPSIAWLFSKKLLDEVGYLDERFTGAGYYADNDYCKRVQEKYNDWGVIVVRGVVLEHRLSQEGKALKVTNQMAHNQKQFNEKWYGDKK
jgi:GT2 family glycosyltransferase